MKHHETYHRGGTYYGIFAVASVILSCFASYFQNQRYYTSEWMVPVTFTLGAVYTVLSILGGHHPYGDRRAALGVYYVLQCAVVTAMIVLSPIRGFFGIIVMPLVAQAVFDLRLRNAIAVSIYLFSLNIAIWVVPFGWGHASEALFSYSTAFAFTIVFAVITRNALLAREREEKLRREVEAANLQLRDYAEQAETLATTRERNRLAREIHDGVGHYLTVVKTQLDAAVALLPAQPEKARDTVQKAARLTGEALEDVRRSVGALRTDTGRPPLPEALKELAAQGVPVPTVAVEGAPRPLSSAVEHALFRAAQEGLTNMRKHARATNALLVLDFRTPQRIRLELSDNGIGATTNAAAAGFGLIGLHERIGLLGGQVKTANRLNGGFALTIEVPA